MYRQAITSLSILFFMIGLITCLNDILVPFMKAVFNLSYAQASLVQFSFFVAYGLASIPCSKLIGRWGYQKVMVLGFFMSATGCLLFYPAVFYNTYELFLIALFVLAAGIVMLQVAANPFVSILGAKELASSRLTMVQAFNSLGTFIAPFLGGHFILSKLEHTNNGPVAVKYPYLFIALLLIVLGVFLTRLKFPVSNHQSASTGTWKEVLKERGLLLGMLAIFVYVGAEVTIGSFLVNYIIERSKMLEQEAANFVALYWGGAMICIRPRNNESIGHLKLRGQSSIENTDRLI